MWLSFLKPWINKNITHHTFSFAILAFRKIVVSWTHPSPLTFGELDELFITSFNGGKLRDPLLLSTHYILSQWNKWVRASLKSNELEVQANRCVHAVAGLQKEIDVVGNHGHQEWLARKEIASWTMLWLNKIESKHQDEIEEKCGKYDEKGKVVTNISFRGTITESKQNLQPIWKQGKLYSFTLQTIFSLFLFNLLYDLTLNRLIWSVKRK